jgi:hypothetical protein
MKRIAIVRKNWLFIGSLRAGIRNASLMSLVASALRMELDVSREHHHTSASGDSEA